MEKYSIFHFSKAIIQISNAYTIKKFIIYMTVILFTPII